MTRKAAKTLTHGELRIMEALWKRNEATVNDVVSELDGKKPVTYKTTQSMLRILEDKGYITHKKEGRSFVYSPLINQRQARLAATKHLIDHFFNSSAGSLISNLLEEEALDAEELEKLKNMIVKAK